MTKKDATNYEELVADRIQDFRTRQKVTQAELAKKVGVSQGALAQYESGARTPTISTLVKIAKALKLRPAFFFVTDDVLVFDVPAFRDHYKTIEKLPDRLYRNLSTIFLLAKKMGFM